MNLIEIYLKINPNSWNKQDIQLRTYKENIIKETEKQIKIKNFGHKFSSIINKEILNQVQKEEILELSVNSISRWIYVKEDNDYNEKELKEMLVNSVLGEINERINTLNKMTKLVNSIAKEE